MYTIIAGLLLAVRLSPADPIADRLVAEALQKTPEVAAARANTEAANRRIVPAGTLPDPSVSLTYQNDGRSLSLGESEGSFLGIMLSQSIPWPGKLSLAADVARSEARELEAGSVLRSELAIEARVRNAWYDLALARALDRLIADRRSAATQIEASVRGRYAAGLAVQQDVLRAQVELARLDEASFAQQAAITTKLAELNRLLARAQDAAIESPADLPDSAELPDTPTILDAVRARSPEVAAARQAIETGRLSTEVAKKNFFPDFVVSGGSMYRGSFEMGPMWQVGVGISIPAWIDRRQKNQLAEARARLEAREAESDVIARELELRTRERLAQLHATLRIAELYRDKILPLDELALESALSSYQNAKVPFVSVLDALNVLYGDRALYLGRLAENARWRVAIDEAALAPTSMTSGASMPGSPAMTTSSSQPMKTTRSASPGSSMSSMR